MKTETPIALIFALSPQLKFVQETNHLAMLGILLYPVKERFSGETELSTMERG